MTPQPARLRVVIAGGGTGGHLYPGIAVAREFLRRHPDATVTFAGTAQGIEARVLPREGFVLDVIRSGGLKGKSLAARVRGVGLLPVSAVDAWSVVSRRSPDLVIGVGGFSAGPVVLAAAVRRVPTLVLEQNAAPGLTNRLLAHVVRAAAVSYESTLPYFKGKAFVSGNPVRPEFFAGGIRTNGERGTDQGSRILIVGGSQGAHAINVAMVEAAPKLAAAVPRLVVTHQTGERDLDMVRTGYRRAGIDARVEGFLFAMEREMTAADLLVCRAGATTLAELAAAGRPAILIPLPTSTDDHQRTNARVMVDAGAAEMLDQEALSGDVLAARIAGLTSDHHRLRAMAAAAVALARPNAAQAIVDCGLSLIAERGVA